MMEGEGKNCPKRVILDRKRMASENRGLRLVKIILGFTRIGLLAWGVKSINPNIISVHLSFTIIF